MHVETGQREYRLLLQLILAQRLEMNAIESALKSTGVLAESQIRDIREEASKTAAAWARDASINVLDLIRVHSSPKATVLAPLSEAAREDLRREINDQTRL